LNGLEKLECKTDRLNHRQLMHTSVRFGSATPRRKLLHEPALSLTLNIWVLTLCKFLGAHQGTHGVSPECHDGQMAAFSCFL